VTVFAALMKWKWLGVQLTLPQWGSILVITAGLCVQSAGSATNSQPDAEAQQHELLGIVSGIVSAVLYAAYYVTGDALLKGRWEERGEETAPSAESLTAFVGVCSITALLQLYLTSI